MKTRLTYHDLKRKMGVLNKSSNIITLNIDGKMVQFAIKPFKIKDEFQLEEQQFNQMINYAIQAYRNGYDERGLSSLDTLLDIIYPDNGEIWNPLARIMFKQYFYVILDDYMSEEYTIRNIEESNNISPAIIANEIDNHYKNLTLATIYLTMLLDSDNKIPDKISDYRKSDTVSNLHSQTGKSYNTKERLQFNTHKLQDNVQQAHVRDMAILSNDTIKSMVSSQKSIKTIYKTVLNGLEQIEK